ncbi:MAG: uroporphyrinogen-III C-methyltransferase [Acidobacteria bacterium]|nr:uroporphyrinogen-III C-methyltransferase [Acidobacteriota bacterium]
MADNSAKTQPGTVYLVGAGPGHPGLITRWGYDLLQQCDAVAYDALIPMELISGLPERVEKYYVGKRAGKHSLPQPRINEMLAALAKRGLRVVRLKGGDPFVFGRIGEEAAYLSAAGVPVVMVPGVTAASAAAAMSGFSLTTRQESSWIFIATGHPAENSSTPVPWDRIGALPGGTLVVYMGIARLNEIAGQLLASGMPPATPAVVVRAASTGLQRSVHAPLISIADECRRRNLKPPALVIIGESVRGRLNDPDAPEKPLSGKKILLTGPARSTGLLCEALREAGAEPIPHPTTIRRGFDDPQGWNRFLETVGRGGICIFQDASVVGRFFDSFLTRGRDIRELAPFKMVAAGEDAAAALRSHGVRADAVAAGFEAGSPPAFIRDFSPRSDFPLVWVHRNPPPPFPELALYERRGLILPLAVETESTAARDARWMEGVLEDPPDCIVFTGESEVTGLVELLGKEACSGLVRRTFVAALQQAAARLLEQYGFPCHISCDTPDAGNLVSLLAERLREK